MAFDEILLKESHLLYTLLVLVLVLVLVSVLVLLQVLLSVSVLILILVLVSVSVYLTDSFILIVSVRGWESKGWGRVRFHPPPPFQNY